MKSNFVIEILKDIKSNPNLWTRTRYGLRKDNIEIKNFGNGSRAFFYWATSIADIEINGNSTYLSLTRSDRASLEEVYLWWMRTVDVKQLQLI